LLPEFIAEFLDKRPEGAAVLERLVQTSGVDVKLQKSPSQPMSNRQRQTRSTHFHVHEVDKEDTKDKLDDRADAVDDKLRSINVVRAKIRAVSNKQEIWKKTQRGPRHKALGVKSSDTVLTEKKKKTTGKKKSESAGKHND
jgi:hypothetical protein